MTDSDLHPTAVDPNATTKTLKRKTMAIPTLTPETKFVVNLAGAIAAAGFIAWISIAAYKMQANSETALANQKEMRDEMREGFKALRDEAKPDHDKVGRLWSDYEWRLAKGNGTALPGVQP